MKFLLFTLLLLAPGYCLASFPSPCSTIISINDVDGVLYKPENIHGGRGPTFLVQNPLEWTGKRKLAIRNSSCKIISYFGLWTTDWPYGARYYQKTGGGKHSAAQLLKLAKTSGNSYILVQARDNRWIKIDNPLKRQGTLLQ